jgi:hypothetical protein
VVCDRCGRQSEHVHFSDYAKQWLCYLCYSRLPEAQSSAEVRRLLPDPKPRKPTTYEEFVHKICDKLEERTGSPVFTFGVDTVAAHCPVCRRGTLTITFVKVSPTVVRARVRSHSAPEAGYCSEGCTEVQVMGALV